MAETLPTPVALMSYAQRDNQDGYLTELHSRLSREASLYIGADFEIFMDQASIELEQNWHEQIENALDEVIFLIPIITPTFFTSKHCRDEVQRFLERERKVGRDDLILPVYYKPATQMDDKAKLENDRIAHAIKAHQYIDWRELRSKPFTDPEVSRALDRMAAVFRDALARQDVQTPVETEPQIAEPFEPAIVRIRREDQTTVGAGFLVSNWHVVTCAHVVAEALHISGDTAERPQGEVQLDFPFYASEARTARVERWQPPEGSSTNPGGNVAVLRLATAPPIGAQPTRLEVGRDLYRHLVSVFGYPDDSNNGQTTSFWLRDQTGNGWFETVKIEPGFSGSPVQDQETKSIVGMVSASAGGNVGYVIPSDVLGPVLPEPIEVAARAIADGWSREDLLGFSDYAKALADLIRDPSTDLPLTIGIDAPWGMGKTTLMRMIESRLRPKPDLPLTIGIDPPWIALIHMIESQLQPKEPEAEKPDSESFPTVWFNAWKYDKVEAMWAALALEILSQTRERVSWQERFRLWFELNSKRLDIQMLALRLLRSLLIVLGIVLTVAISIIAIGQVTESSFQDVVRQMWKYVAVIGGLGVAATLYNTIIKDVYKRLTNPFQLKIGEFMKQPDYEEKIGFLGQFEDDFKHVISSVTDNGNKRLVIFIDDLDRAAPPKPVEVIEAINMLVDCKYCVFVLGMDSHAVARSIEAKYKGLKDYVSDADTDEPFLGRRFLEKIVQIPFAIPRAGRGAFTAFINRNLGVEEQQEDLPEERTRAESFVQEKQRLGETPEEAGETLRSETNVPEQIIQEVVQEVRAKSFGDSEEVRQAISVALPYLGFNPRKVKRFINLFQLQALIANRRGRLDNGTIELDRLAKWMLVSMGWPAVTEAIIADHSFQDRLLEAHRLIRDELPNVEDEEQRAELVRNRLESLLEDPAVKRLYRTEDLIELLEEVSGPDAEVLPYLQQTEVTTSRS